MYLTPEHFLSSLPSPVPSGWSSRSAFIFLKLPHSIDCPLILVKTLPRLLGVPCDFLEQVCWHALVCMPCLCQFCLSRPFGILSSVDRSGNTKTWVRILTPPVASSGTRGSSSNFSEPQCVCKTFHSASTMYVQSTHPLCHSPADSTRIHEGLATCPS